MEEVMCCSRVNKRVVGTILGDGSDFRLVLHLCHVGTKSALVLWPVVVVVVFVVVGHLWRSFVEHGERSCHVGLHTVSILVVVSVLVVVAVLRVVSVLVVAWTFIETLIHLVKVPCLAVSVVVVVVVLVITSTVA